MHNVCRSYFEDILMYLHRKIEDAELIDLLAIHTNRLTQMMIYGETYIGEYETCRSTIELIQNEILSRRGFCMNTASHRYNFNQISAIKF